MFEFGPETSKEPSSCALLRIHKIGRLQADYLHQMLQ